MPREVTDEEYNFLQSRRQVADFVESIYNDPSLNKEAKALIKRKYPQIQIPDHDLEERFDKRIDELKKERDDERRSAKEAEEEKKYTEARSKVQKDYGFTDDGMKDLEKMMVERNIGDYEVAATFHSAKNPKPIDADHGDGFWHHSKQDGFKEISADPEGWARNEILSALRKDSARGVR
jgi:hypothetical protein